MYKKFKKIFILFLLIIIISIFLITILQKKVMPIYLNYAEGEMESLIVSIINKSVSDTFANEFNNQELFYVKKDESKTMIVDFDPIILNKIMGTIAINISDIVKKLSEKDKSILEKYHIDENIFYIPTGIIFNNIFLNNLGPKIPIKMELVSMVNPTIETKVSEYGINNSLIEIFIKVVSHIRMILPTASKMIEISVLVPVSVSIIQGNIPEYYFGSLNKKNNS